MKIIDTKIHFHHVLSFCLSYLSMLAVPQWNLVYANSSNTETKTTQAHSTVELISEHKAMYAGETYYIGLDIKLDPKWHTYWINPGDSASASIFKFKPIPGVTIGDPIYPTPTRYQVGPFYSFGYENRVLIQFPVEISRRFPHRQISFELSAEWLVCQEECIPGFYDFKLTLPSPPSNKGFSKTEMQMIRQATLNTEHQDLFANTRKSWPQGTHVSKVEKKNEIVEVEVELLHELRNLNIKNIVDVFPYPQLNVSNKRPELIEKAPNGHKALVALFEFESKSTSDSNSWNFLVSYKDEDGQLKSTTLTSNPPLVSRPSFLIMLAFGFLGGLILNLMPCVFPILMLKVFQVVHSHQEKSARSSLLLYVLGVLVSFWILALIILSLQAAGHIVGWGFQLQSPMFTLFLIGLFTLMGIYFLGFLPIPSFKFLNMGQGLAQRQDHIGAFFTGVLAVVVASPCTAPFMGAAMGYALSRSTPEVLAIFTSLGFGLSFPFLLLALFPKSLSWLPKPGAWMIYFKKLMALPLFATALWLGWVFAQQLTPISTEDGYWETYAPEKVENLKSHQPVFVNFTASWCISCQVNERIAFQNEEVRTFIKNHNIKMLKADWTQKNPEIADILRSYGRAGVPLYLFFTPQNQKPLILPEVLTPQILIHQLTEELNRP